MAIRFLNSQSIDGELTVTENVGIGTTSPAFKFDLLDDYDMPSSGAYLADNAFTYKYYSYRQLNSSIWWF